MKLTNIGILAAFVGLSLNITGCHAPPVKSTQGGVSIATPKYLSQLVDFPIGVAVASNGKTADVMANAARAQLVTREFSQISAENIMKMKFLYGDQGFNFAHADSLILWAKERNLQVHGHALVWHSAYQLPAWANDNNDHFKKDYEHHVREVAKHFSGKVTSWDVVNEALFDASDNPDQKPSANGLRQSVFYRQFKGVDYIDTAFRIARQQDAKADLYYNDFNTEDNRDKTDHLVTLVKGLIDRKVPIDGVGFQMHVLRDYPNIKDIRASLKKVVSIDNHLKIKLSELDVRINNIYDKDDANDIRECNLDCEGFKLQKERYKEIVSAYLEVVPPHRRGGITIWGLADEDSWYAKLTRDTYQVPDWPLLFTDTLAKKPAYEGLFEALQISTMNSASDD